MSTENLPYIKKNFMTEHRKQIVSFASHANSVYVTEDKTLEEILIEIQEKLDNLPTDLNVCSKIVLECDDQTYELRAVLYNKDNEIIYTSNVIDLPIETLIVSVTYDAENDKLIITYKGGEVVEIPVSSMTSGLQEKITLDNPLPAELISGLAEVAFSGDYNDLENIPSINGVRLVGDLSLEDLGIHPGGTDDYNDLNNKPKINDVMLVGELSLADIGITCPGGDEFHANDYYTKSNIDDLLDDFVDPTELAQRVGIGYDNSNDTIFVYLEDGLGNSFPLLEGLPITALNKLSRDKVVSGAYDATNKKIILTKENGSTQSFTIADLIQGLASEGYVDAAIATLPTTSDIETIVTSALTPMASKEYVQDALQTVPTQQDLERKQDKLTAGANITIENNVISATGGGGGGSYTGVDPIAIFGSSITFNRTLDETVAAGNAGSTLHIPTNKAMTEYVGTAIQDYITDHSSEIGRTYSGLDPIALTGNVFYFNMNIDSIITDNNKTSTIDLPTNAAVTGYVENYYNDHVDGDIASYITEHSSEIGRTYSCADPIALTGNVFYLNRTLDTAITDDNKSYTSHIPTNLAVSSYVDNAVETGIADYISKHSSEIGKTYTGTSPIIVTGTNISFDRLIDTIITNDNKTAVNHIPTNNAVTTYVDAEITNSVPSEVANYISAHASEIGKTYTGTGPITVNGTVIGFNKTIVATIDTTTPTNDRIPTEQAVTNYVSSIVPVTPSTITDGVLYLGF